SLSRTAQTLHANVVELMVAGSSAVAATILYVLFICAENPATVQAKVQGEIDRVVGPRRTPTWEDHNSMPYTMAAIWETYRWKTLNTLNLPREADEDVFLNGYLIPKGTVIVANLWAVHFDTKYWKNPERFDPSRFLTQDGSALISKPEYLIPFSIGKRMCPGVTLATVEIFLCVTTLLQKFHVKPDDRSRFCVETDLFKDLLEQGLRFPSRMTQD
ncbi:unnamed protein product, partial [Ixodes hexagonus]